MVGRYVRIALFVIVTAVAATVYVMQLSEEIGTGNTYTVHAFVDDASGLVLDSNVTLAGVNVGRLKDIELEDGRAKLTLEVHDEVELYQDAVVAKETQSVLGTSMVTLNPGSGQGARLSDGGVVENVRRQATISDAVDSAEELVAGMSDFLEGINSFFGDQGTVARMNEIIQVVQGTAQTTSSLLQQNLEIARTTMENLQTASLEIEQATAEQLNTLATAMEGAVTLADRLNQLVAVAESRLVTSFDGADATIADLRSSVGQVGPVVEGFETTLKGVDGLVAELQVSAEEIRDTSTRLFSQDGTLGSLDATVEEVNLLVQDLRGVVGGMNDFAGSLSSDDGTVGNLDSAIQEVNLLVQDLRGVAGEMGDFTRQLSSEQGTLGKLITDDELYGRAVQVVEEADTFMDSAQTFAESAERVAVSADDLLQSTTAVDFQVDFKSEVLVNRIVSGQEGWTKDHFTVRLIPGGGDKYYSLGVVNTPYPIEETVTTVTSGGDNAGTEEVLTRRQDIRLSAQLARVWGPLTLRAGLFENYGGLAFDYRPIPQLEISAEGFDFGNSSGPYVRTFGTVYPFFDPDSDNPVQWLYVSGGADDIAGQNQLNGFVSIGARLTDKDLRNFVTLIPLVQ